MSLLGKAIKNVIVATGIDSMASEQVRNNRFGKCLNCALIKKNNHCKLCGCDMSEKTWLENAKCDMGKW